MKRHYRVAELFFDLDFESPYSFMPLTGEQEELAEKLRSGEDVGVLPVPADIQEQIALNDRLIGRQTMTKEVWESMDESHRKEWNSSFDMFQYSPFEVAESGEDFIFSMHIKSGFPEWAEDKSGWKKSVTSEDEGPYYWGYEDGESSYFEFYGAADVMTALMRIKGEEVDFHILKKIRKTILESQLNTAIMIAFTMKSIPRRCLLLHASVIRHNVKANLFFGASGTGKSTHSRLWLTNIPDCDLLNDDNPVVRVMEDGKVMVFGSPWSGKTVCYRNISTEVRAFVRIERDTYNHAEKLEGIEAFASIYSSTSALRWRKELMDCLMPTVEAASMKADCWKMYCRPDAEAAEICLKATES